MPSRQRRNKITVLLCDDHAVVREGTRRLLEEEDDIEVVGEASDGLEAIELARELSPCVVAMDVSMPRMNGIEATKEVKRVSPNSKILALTAYDDFAYVKRLIENGASGYILKSARAEELIAAVRATAFGGSIFDEQVAKKVFGKFLQDQAQSTSNDKLPERPPSNSVLTQKETEVLILAGRGLSNKEIAHLLNVSPRTIQTHLGSVFNKLGVSSRTEAVVTALNLGIVSKSDLEDE
jgi:NarL family two-component system response regulator LiaR